MSGSETITFAVPVAVRGEILATNFLSSPCLQSPHNYQILIQENFPSAANAFNDAMDRSVNDLIVFVHQDVLLPESWPLRLMRALECLGSADPNWGVLGCWGASREDGCRGYIYSSGEVLGAPFERPAPIQTLDEIILIVRKSTGLRFDEKLPYFHLHGTDICLAAGKRGMKNYVIPAFCVHNNSYDLILPKEFYQCYELLKKKWESELPIQTACIQITKSDGPMYARRLREAYLRYIRRKESAGVRARDVGMLLKDVDAMLRSSKAYTECSS
jgi:hypothetical protein